MRFLIFIILSAILITSCKKEELDPNFTYDAYNEFLKKMAANEDIVFEPLYRFDSVDYPDKILVGLRHDIDIDLKGALEMGFIESQYNIKCTYYILHTAKYYTKGAIDIHNENIIPLLLELQDKYGHEIGWHNDLVTLQVVYDKNPITFFNAELSWLRQNKINIYGSASHGSDYCHIYGYHNHYFFEDYNSTLYDEYPNNLVVPINNINKTIVKGTNEQFNLSYEAYHIKYNKYYSDCSYPEGERWHPGMIDFSTWKKGDRIVILTHPTHWYQYLQ